MSGENKADQRVVCLDVIPGSNAIDWLAHPFTWETPAYGARAHLLKRGIPLAQRLAKSGMQRKVSAPAPKVSGPAKLQHLRIRDRDEVGVGKADTMAAHHLAVGVHLTPEHLTAASTDAPQRPAVVQLERIRIAHRNAGSLLGGDRVLPTPCAVLGPEPSRCAGLLWRIDDGRAFGYNPIQSVSLDPGRLSGRTRSFDNDDHAIATGDDPDRLAKSGLIGVL